MDMRLTYLRWNVVNLKSWSALIQLLRFLYVIYFSVRLIIVIQPPELAASQQVGVYVPFSTQCFWVFLSGGVAIFSLVINIEREIFRCTPVLWDCAMVE